MDLPIAWVKAGRIAGEARVYGASLIKEGVRYIDVSEKIEEFIFKKGGKLGFPVQISINGMAAHYTPFPNDVSVFNRGDLVKLDLGVQVDGYIGDNAVTIEVGTKDHTDLIKASKEALDAALKLARPGVKIGEIGAAVASTIESYGYRPIRNLSGHGVSRFTLHDSPSIPNYDNKDPMKLQEGQVLAIEPFATAGVGLVKEGKGSSNYRLAYPNKQVRDANARKVLEYIKEEFYTLPFAKRYLTKVFEPTKVTLALLVLEKAGLVYEYAQLPEKENGLTSQHEHTVYVADKPVILTKGD